MADDPVSSDIEDILSSLGDALSGDSGADQESESEEESGSDSSDDSGDSSEDDFVPPKKVKAGKKKKVSAALKNGNFFPCPNLSAASVAARSGSE